MADATTPDTTSTSSDPAAGGAPAAPPAAFYEAFADKALASTPSVQNFKTVEDLAKGYVSLEKRFGIDPNRRIDLPADLNDAEAMRAVWTKLGLPEKPDGYGLKMPDGAPDSDKQTLAAFTETAHKLGVPPGMAKGLFEWWANQGAQAAEAQRTALEERGRAGTEALKAEFGQAYEEVNRKLDGFVQKYFDKEMVEALSPENRVLYPNLVKGLAKIIGAIAEPGALDGRSGDAGGGFGGGALTPERARAARATLEGDPVKSKALFDRDHPQHKAVVAERNRLLAMEN